MREDKKSESEPETPLESLMAALTVCALIYFLMFL